jgi:hypothetical protein
LRTNQARFLASITELDHRVMAETKALRRIADRRSTPSGAPRDLEQELMLLRLETTLLRRRLTEVKKQAQLVAKFGERLKHLSLAGDSHLLYHVFIIS